MDNFEPLRAYEGSLKEFGGRIRGGTVTAPWASAEGNEGDGYASDDIFEAAKDAGRQLVEDGRMSPETLRVVSRELLPLEMFVQVLNQRFQESLVALEKE